MHAGKTLRWAGAGATPLLTAYSRPKAPWGRSRPSPNTGDRVLPACITEMYSTLNAEERQFGLQKGEDGNANSESTAQTTQNHSRPVTA